jgi:DNA-binding PadR family transcriptional regulator
MLYRSLDELVKREWIEPVPDPSEAPDERRQYYRITGSGKRRLLVEAETLSHWADLAKTRTS